MDVEVDMRSDDDGDDDDDIDPFLNLGMVKG